MLGLHSIIELQSQVYTDKHIEIQTKTHTQAGIYKAETHRKNDSQTVT